VYEYKCKIRRIVDGDTMDVDIDLGFNVVITKERVRIYGIDTPESRTRDLVEKKYGLAAKDFAKKFLLDHDPEVTLVCKEYDAKGKFGRILGDFRCKSKMLSQVMVEFYHAVPYYGQNKDKIEESHLANRKLVKLV
jgi:micrococcal nuclease